MAVDELTIVRLRKDFYRDGASRIFLVIVILLLATVILSLTSVYLFVQKPAPVTFVTNADGRSFPAAPVDQPYFKDADLLQWFMNVIPKSFTFDFINYQTQLLQVPQFYTEQGYAKLKGILNTYANSEQVQSQKLFITGAPKSAPIILNHRLLTEGPSSGHYAWLVQVPILLSFKSGANAFDTPLNIQAMLIRTDSPSEIAALLIDDMVVVSTQKAAPAATPGNGSTMAPSAPATPSTTPSRFSPVPAPLSPDALPGQVNTEGAS